MTPYFRHILNLYPWMKYEVPEGVDYKELRMLDSHHIDTAFIDSAMEWLQAAFDADDGPILVHCQAGINRSNLTMATFLVTRLGWDPAGVIDHIRQMRCATALCNPAFEDYVRGLTSAAH